MPMIDNLLDSILDRQKRSWREGNRPSVEELLTGSSLQHDSEAQLDLVYNEVVVREELGEDPSPEEYFQRYPHLKKDLAIHFEVHRAVKDNLLTETRHVKDEESLPAIDDSVRDALPRLNDYELLCPLGQGAMGIVYKARHRRLHRHVALKMFQPGRLPSSREVLRFRTEAEAIARLQHPNIVQIFEIGECNGLPYLALELAEQGTLAQKLQQLQFKPRAAAELVETLARAVHHAHGQHIVHRDLKPANVLFTREGAPKITDFGLAKVLQEDADSGRDATRSGEPIGTPRYMSPEQAAGRQDRIGPATDVYALGTLLYECMTGQVPFVSTSVMETMEKIRSDEPLSPRRLQPSIPRDLETICLHCLHKEPGRRYAGALALADDLRRFQQGEPIHARPTSARERVWKWCRRHPAHAILAAVGILLVFTGLTLVVVLTRLEQQRIARARNDLDGLVKEGQEAVLLKDWDTAQARFGRALEKINGEPALNDYQTGVAGWLDHCRRALHQHQWKRLPPREFDEMRDEALLQSLLLDPLQQEPVRVARQAIQTALEFTIAGDPAWGNERAQLILLDAELVFRETGPEGALARLARVEGLESRLFHERRAVYLERLGRNAEAERERLRGKRFPAENIPAEFLSGIDRLRGRDFGGALRDFEKVLSSAPEHFTARLFQAVCFLHRKRPGEARVGLTACIAQRPRFAWSYLFRARASQQTGDLAAALHDLQHALNLNPPKPARFALLNDLGLLHLQLQQGDQARVALKKAIEVLPAESSARVNLARVEARQKQWALAETHFAKAIALQPGQSSVYRTRSACYREEGKWNEALADLDRAVEREPASSLLRAGDQVERARVLRRLNKLPEALQATREALRSKEDLAEAWQVQGEILSRQKRYAEAVAAFDRCAAAGAVSFDLYRDRGIARMKGGAPAAAIDDFSRALMLRADADLFQRRGRAYFLANALPLARRDFDEAVKLQPAAPDALIGRALILICLKEYQAALVDARKAGKLFSGPYEICWWFLTRSVFHKG